MAVDRDAWVRRKTEFWSRMWEDLEIGYLDKDLLPLLILLNTDENIYTMSSCSGRITASDSETPWSRSSDSSIVFKKHVFISPEEVLKLYTIPVYRRIWLNVTGPIIHLSTFNTATAVEVLRIARLSGYKHSGIMNLSRRKGILLELTTGIYLSIPLRTPSGNIVEPGEVEELTRLVNEVLYQGKKRLSRLYSELRRSLPWNPDRYILGYLEEHGLRMHERDPLDVFRELSGL